MSEAELQALNAQLAADPQWRALVAAWNQHPIDPNTNRTAFARAAAPFSAYLKAKGIELPGDVAITPKTGTLDASWTNSTAGAIGLSAIESAALIAGGYGATSLIGGGAGAAGAGGGAAGAGAGSAGAGSGGTLATLGGAGSGGALPTTATYAGSMALPGAGSTVAGQAAAPSLFGSFVHSLTSPTVIGEGLNLAGSYLQSRAVGQAADQEAQSARDALGVATQEYNTNTGLNVAQANQNTQGYNQTVSNLSPYRGIGASALSALGYGLGLPGYEGGNTSVVNAPAPITPIRPLAVPPPITPPGSSQPGQAIANQTYTPTNQITNGLPQTSTGNTWSPITAQAQTQSSAGPRVGQQGVVNGVPAVFDGRGWKAAQGSA